MIEKLKKFFVNEVKPIIDKLNSSMLILSSDNSLKVSMLDEPAIFISIDDKYTIVETWNDSHNHLMFTTTSPEEFIRLWNSYIIYIQNSTETLPKMNMRWISEV